MDLLVFCLALEMIVPPEADCAPPAADKFVCFLVELMDGCKKRS